MFCSSFVRRFDDELSMPVSVPLLRASSRLAISEYMVSPEDEAVVVADAVVVPDVDAEPDVPPIMAECTLSKVEVNSLSVIDPSPSVSAMLII